MKTFRYAIFGFIVGATLGAILGSGQLFTRHRTKQQLTADFRSWQWAFYGGIVGAVILGSIGAADDKKEKAKSKEESVQREQTNAIRSELGLQPYPRIETLTEAQSPVHVTRWIDPRNQKTYILRTYRDDEGRIVSALGAFKLVHDRIQEANDEAITAAHSAARVLVFRRLLSAFEQDNQICVEDVFT